ncbi:hypothetical protein KI387_011725, partial [Taxus chinensis]
GHSHENCKMLKNIVQEMVDVGDITIDNPNAPANRNLKIFNKPFPNHSSNSNTNQETLAEEKSVHEIHVVFNSQPRASIEEILNRASSLMQESSPPSHPSGQEDSPAIPLPIKDQTTQSSLLTEDPSYTTSLQDCEQ